MNIFLELHPQQLNTINSSFSVTASFRYPFSGLSTATKYFFPTQLVAMLTSYTCCKYLYFFYLVFHLGHIWSYGKETKRIFIQRKTDLSDINKFVLEFGQREFKNQDNAELDPIQYYRRFMNNKLLDKIVDESNKEAIKNNPSIPLNLTRNELENFWGILYVMSSLKMPSTKFCQSSELIITILPA